VLLAVAVVDAVLLAGRPPAAPAPVPGTAVDGLRTGWYAFSARTGCAACGSRRRASTWATSPDPLTWRLGAHGAWFEGTPLRGHGAP
jgi:hypothetical protein